MSDGRDPGGHPPISHGFPDVVPPVGGLFVDQSGRLWMGRQQVPPRNLPSAMGMEIPQWMVLDDLDVPYVEWRRLEGG